MVKRNVLTALLAIVVAFGLWLYVVTVVSPDSDNTYHGVSVVLQGEAILEDRGLMITMDEIPTVSLRLEGNRSELQKLNSSNISVAVDVSKIATPGEHPLPISPSNVRLPGDVSYSAITVTNRNPDSIKLVVAERASKPVDVEVVWLDSIGNPEYIPDKANIQLNYQKIQVSGPADVVNKIEKARIYVDLKDKTETFSESQQFTLCDKNGEPVDAKWITTDVGEVEFTLRILKVKKVDLKYSVVTGGGATLDNAEITMDIDSIQVSGTEAALQGLDSITVGVINLAELEEDAVLPFTINLPEGVGNQSGVSTVLVTVKFTDLDIKTLGVTNIVPANVPEGREAEIITEALEIRFRGPKDLLERLQPENVTVMVDFSDAVETATMQAVITLDEEFAQIGAIGSYTVVASLK